VQCMLERLDWLDLKYRAADSNVGLMSYYSIDAILGDNQVIFLPRCVSRVENSMFFQSPCSRDGPLRGFKS